MKISDTGLDLIKRYEGYRGEAYKCPAGVWTIGYGHTAGVKEGMSCTKEQATEWLKEDVLSAERAVNKYAARYRFNQSQYDAMVSFTYNCGAGNLDKLVRKGYRTIKEIADKMLAYNKGGGKELPGLVRRRTEERALFLSSVNTTGSYYPIYEGSGTSLDIMLDTVGAGVDRDTTAKSAWRQRLPIAKANGINNYTGTAQQNILLKSLLLKGECKRP